MTYCDRVIAPATCVQRECEYLYAYDDPLTKRRYMGCVHKVFGTEIDVVMFEEAERSQQGFGTVKLARAPLSRCAFEVERAHDRAVGPDFSCVNRRFFDWPDSGPDAVRAFDLRDACHG